MTNREKFQEVFNLYAEEMWSFDNEEFLAWADKEYNAEKLYTCSKCGKRYSAKPQRQLDTFYGFYFWETICPYCGAYSEFNDCYWR